MRRLLLATGSLVLGTYTLFANGGAWQGGVPGTGSASASNNNRRTNVTIEDETLKIDLHPDYADVNVRYRMRNTGPKADQDFFFPVERWGQNPDADTDEKGSDITDYQIRVDGSELESTNVSGGKKESSETTSGSFWQENEVGLDENAKASSACLIPIVLKDGLPEVDAAPESWRLVNAQNR
jgi:hypothetical protein